MRWGSKTLLVALVALLLGAGLVACGGDDDSDTSTTGIAQGQATTEAGGASADGEQDGSAGEESKAKRDGYGGSGSGSEGDSSYFVPKQHQDSGGGSEQFRVEGGDNSVQEFGEEAGDSDREEAAEVLHNFLDARAELHWAAACEYMSSSVAKSLQQLASQGGGGAGSCAAILEKLTNPGAKQLLLDEAAQADVGSLRIEGERAFVIYRGPDDEILAVPMTLEDGSWKVAALAGTPLS